MMKKVIALVLSLAMALSLVACGGTEAPKEDVAILYTNDVHTYIDGTISYDVIAAVKEELKAQYKNVLLVDAGDHSQGTVYGSMDFGETIIELMAIPRDTVVIIKDSIQVPAISVHCGDAWFDFEGILTAENFSGTLHNRDSLIVAETVRY